MESGYKYLQQTVAAVVPPTVAKPFCPPAWHTPLIAVPPFFAAPGNMTQSPPPITPFPVFP